VAIEETLGILNNAVGGLMLSRLRSLE